MAKILVSTIISVSVGNFSIGASTVAESFFSAKILASIETTSTLGTGSTRTPSLIEILATTGALSTGIGSSSV